HAQAMPSVGADACAHKAHPAAASQPDGQREPASGPDWEALLASLACPPSAGAQAPAAAPVAATPVLPPAPKVPVAPVVEMPAPAPASSAAQTASSQPNYGRRATDDPLADGMRAGRRQSDNVVIAKDATIRIDTARLDQVLNLSGEIGLTKNRLNCLRAELVSGKTDAATLRSLDEAIGQLDLLVGDLQNAVMKTRMQPVGRLFQKYPRLVRDLARQL